MEEYVGQLWHRLITGVADSQYAQAAVELSQVQNLVGVMFRALGGDGGLRVEAADATIHGARRSWLQRVAGSAEKVELAWRDANTLRLPARLACFPERSLNRDLYLWLAALAAAETEPTLAETDGSHWCVASQQQTQRVLERLPGLQARYQRLIAAYLPLRPQPARLPAAEAAQELAIQQALQQPGSVTALVSAQRPPQPVLLWLHPAPPRPPAAQPRQPQTDSAQQRPPTAKKTATAKNPKRRAAERVDTPDGNKGLLAFRLESLFTRAEYVNLDRCSDDEDNLSNAQNALEDMDKISVSQDRQTVAAALRFDLDLPPESSDEQALGAGILWPEWDYKQRRYRADYARLVPMSAREAEASELPETLRRTARRLRRQFEALNPHRTWFNAQQEGCEIDLNAYLNYSAARLSGTVQADQGLYRDFRGGSRDLACLLLADLSLSTDAWVNNHARVIDVIRDSLFLFAESLQATGDRFALYGFSSRYRQEVRFHCLKDFQQPYNAQIRRRIHGIRPGYYTRMGTAIRHASHLLSQQRNSQRLLLLLTDGKPNDLDQYEGRYGIEDTRMALHEARKQGLQPFCVTIDEKAGDYLPHLFGSHGYVLIHNPAQLPRELPLLYMRLTQG